MHGLRTSLVPDNVKSTHKVRSEEEEVGEVPVFMRSFVDAGAGAGRVGANSERGGRDRARYKWWLDELAVDEGLSCWEVGWSAEATTFRGAAEPK